MSEVTLFKNFHGAVPCCTVFGRVDFVGGRFFTKDAELERKLKHLAKSHEHGIYIDDNEPTVDPDAATPYDLMRKKIIAEYLASQGEVVNAGESHAKGLGQVVSTADSPVFNNRLADQMQEARMVKGADGVLVMETTQIPENASPAQEALAAIAAQTGVVDKALEVPQVQEAMEKQQLVQTEKPSLSPQEKLALLKAKS